MELKEILDNCGYKYCATCENGRCIVIFAMPYKPYKPLAAGYGCIDAYYVASNAMYHRAKEIVKEIEGNGHKIIGDNVWLKPMGQRGGLGSILRNSLLCNSRYGTRMVLSSVIVESDLAVHLDEGVGDVCANCDRCVEECPTGAIGEILTVKDCLRCHQEYPNIIHPLMGNRVLGCDTCQRCCPHNAAEMVDMPEGLMELLSIDNLRLAVKNPQKLAKQLVPWIGKNYARAAVIGRLAANYVVAVGGVSK